MKFGVELEGGFESSSACCRDCHMKTDSSVSVRTDVGFTGECVSSVLNGWSAVENWIRRHAPVAANTTCGFHLHMSFGRPWRTALNVARMAENFRTVETGIRDAVAEKLEELRAAGAVRQSYHDRMYTRLQGDNNYCALSRRERPIRETIGEAYGDGSRYRMLNLSAFDKHGTVELRLFAGGTKRDAEAMIALADAAVRFVRSFLQQRPRTRWESLPAEDDSINSCITSALNGEAHVVKTSAGVTLLEDGQIVRQLTPWGTTMQAVIVPTRAASSVQTAADVNRFMASNCCAECDRNMDPINVDALLSRNISNMPINTGFTINRVLTVDGTPVTD